MRQSHLFSALLFAGLFAVSVAPAQPPETLPLTPSQQMPADIPAPADARTINDRMRRLDQDQDGRIARTEADVDMKLHWDQWDFDKDGFLSLTEFTSGLSLNRDNRGGKTGKQ